MRIPERTAKSITGLKSMINYIGKRINLERSEEIVKKQVSNVAVGCPFCLTMIEDGMKELEKEEEVKTLDIAELVEKCMA